MYPHAALYIQDHAHWISPDSGPSGKHNIIFMIRMRHDSYLPPWVKDSDMIWAYPAQMSLVTACDVTPIFAQATWSLCDPRLTGHMTQYRSRADDSEEGCPPSPVFEDHLLGDWAQSRLSEIISTHIWYVNGCGLVRQEGILSKERNEETLGTFLYFHCGLSA